jgi:hypothetical protein
MRLRLLLAPLLLAGSLQARSLADLAIQGVLQAADPDVTSLHVVHRAAVTPELDLVLAVGERRWRGDTSPQAREKLGLFLQERARPDLVYTLVIEPNTCGCGGDVGILERVTATDTVISCEYEKSDRQPHRKFVYDVRAKALVGRLSYQPFDMVRAFATGSGAVLVGFDGKRLVGVAFEPQREPQLRLMGSREALPWTRQVKLVENWAGTPSNTYHSVEPPPFEPFAFGPGQRFWLTEIRDSDDPEDGHLLIQEDLGRRWKRHRMPRSTMAEYAKARPEELENVGPQYENDEGIGPHQLVGDVLWFGKSFYDAEGDTGVGGFGTFDASTATFEMTSPPEMRDWSVGAMHVGPDAIWMTLVHEGEWGDASGGLMRRDRASGAVRILPLPEVGRHLVRVGDHVLVATDLGFAVAHGDEIRHVFIDVTTDGRLRLADRMPPAADDPAER